MSKQQGNLEISAKGALPGAPSYVDPDASTPSNAERIADLQHRTAEARAGLSVHEKQKLTEWWTRFWNSSPGPEVTGEKMAAAILNPVAKWAKNSPSAYLVAGSSESPAAARGLVSIIAPDGKLDYLSPYKIYRVGLDISEADAKRLVSQKAGTFLPCLTLRVLSFSWPHSDVCPFPKAVRGELVLFHGSTDDRRIKEDLESGCIETLQVDGRYNGPLDQLHQCPMPTRKDPDGRIYLNNYTPAAGPEVARFVKPAENHAYPPMPRTINCLIPDPPKGPQSRDWCSTPLIRCRSNLTGTFAEHWHLRDQEEITLYEWVAVMGTVRTNRHGEPVLEILGDLTEQGREFKADVTTFLESHPGALSDAEGFPVFDFATQA